MHGPGDEFPEARHPFRNGLPHAPFSEEEAPWVGYL